MEKEYASARNRVRRSLKTAAQMEPVPNISRMIPRSTPTSTIEDDGVHADPIPGLRAEPVYVLPE